MGQLFKERICSLRSKFFSLRVDPNEKGNKTKSGRVPSPESVPINHKSLVFPPVYMYVGQISNIVNESYGMFENDKCKR